MHFLLTNDDGFDAPGLAALASAISALPSVRVSIVAPEDEQSMCGHGVTTRRALQVRSRGEDRWSVAGMPTDCVRLALYALNLKPDWVISGINAGGNMGQDIVISGTLSAAREAAYHGLAAMAFSHYLIKGIDVDWPRAASWVTEIVRTLSAERLHDGEYWNINFPHHPPGPLAMPPLVRCHPERQPLNVAYATVGEGSYHYTASYSERPRIPGSDVDVCFGGQISVSRLKL